MTGPLPQQRSASMFSEIEGQEHMKSDQRAVAGPVKGGGALDTSSHEEFYRYYARQSVSEETRTRFLSLRGAVLRAIRMARGDAMDGKALDILDVGCGAGTHSALWAELDHRVHGLDISEQLIQLARQRAAADGLDVDFRVGTATSLPWTDSSMDVCLAQELLEHVPDWGLCLDEFERVLRPGGILILSTNNKLCPFQHEFNLPFYSWYPAGLKRRFERLAVTTRKDLANFATYPAVNWFTHYSLAAELRKRNFAVMDRFNVMDSTRMSRPKRFLLTLIGSVPPLRHAAFVVMTSIFVYAVKRV